MCGASNAMLTGECLLPIGHGITRDDLIKYRPSLCESTRQKLHHRQLYGYRRELAFDVTGQSNRHQCRKQIWICRYGSTDVQGGRTAQGLVRLVNRGQQLDVGPRVAFGKTAPPVDGRPHPAGGHVARDQPRQPRTAHPGHLLDVTPRQATGSLALLRVLLLDQIQPSGSSCIGKEFG